MTVYCLTDSGEKIIADAVYIEVRDACEAKANGERWIFKDETGRG